MARDEGFTVADMDPNYLDDTKVRHLWRILAPSVADMCEALVLHEATVLASWREGSRVKVNDAAPIWMGVRSELVAALILAKLLDHTERVPTRSWAAWFGPAQARREARIEAGRRGGMAKAQRGSSNATAGLYPSDRPSDRPSVPTDLPTSTARGRAARRGGKAAPRAEGPTPLREVLAATPFGQEHEARRSSS